jgi:ACS family allantoate permease-like MFS transporter
MRPFPLVMILIDKSNNGARYAGYILTLQYPICVLFIISFMTSSFGGTTKKVAISAAYQVGFAVGNIVGPQTFIPSNGPDYPIAIW